MLTPENMAAIKLSLELAACVTLILLIFGTPLAWWLARSESSWTAPVGAVVALPLVLPPTVLGFYLLLAMGPSGRFLFILIALRSTAYPNCIPIDRK